MRLQIIFLALFGTLALAQNMPPAAPVQSDTTVKYTKDWNAPKPAQKHTSELTGRCTVLPGPGNMIETPCTEVILTLASTTGGESVSTRTDHDGTFQFTTEAGMSYKLVSGSRLLDVASPTGNVAGGQPIEVHLKQK